MRCRILLRRIEALEQKGAKPKEVCELLGIPFSAYQSAKGNGECESYQWREEDRQIEPFQVPKEKPLPKPKPAKKPLTEEQIRVRNMSKSERAKYYRQKYLSKPYAVLDSRLKSFVKKQLGAPVITVDQVLTKFGLSPVCYLTGQPIDYNDPKSFNLDHYRPVSKGGPSTLENLRLCSPEGNRIKGTLSVPELIQLCQRIVQWNELATRSEKTA